MREWDKNNQENINKYHKSVIQRSGLNSQLAQNSEIYSGAGGQMGFKVTTDGNNMIKDYMNDIFETNDDRIAK